MKTIFLILISMIATSATSIYDFKVEGLNGETINFADFKGKKILIVNTASECGYTPQYKDLQTLYEKYNGKLVIIGFPSNEFGAQEPGSNSEIAAFCQKNYGVTFPMAAKIAVKGEGQHPLYKWLTQKELNGAQESEVKWNFHKYLIDEQGKLVGVYSSKVKPCDDELVAAIEK